MDVARVVGSAQLERYRSQLASWGYIFLQNLPPDFDYLGFVQTFGRLLPQYDGQTVWSIKADPKFDGLYHSLNTKPLFPHTECYEFSGKPNKYQALWCLTPPGTGGGETTLADFYKFFESLGPVERELLTRDYNFHSSAGIQASNLGVIARHPVVSQNEDSELILRFSFNCMEYQHDPQMVDLAARVVRFFDEQCMEFTWGKGDILLWDNWRMLHSRTGYEDRSRELKRVWLAKHEGLEPNERKTLVEMLQ